MPKKKEEKKQVVEASNYPIVSVLDKALTHNADIDLDKLKQFMELQVQHEEREAKKLYMQALLEFKEASPKIIKDKLVSFQSTRYRHASLEKSNAILVESLAPLGLILTWESRVTENKEIEITAVLSHVSGHSERTSLRSAPDASGKKNSIQAIGSATTYLMRYTAFLLLGIAPAEDDDGHKYSSNKSIQKISDKQKSELVDLIDAYEVDEEKFLNFMQVENIEDIPKTNFLKAKNALLKKGKK